MRSKIFNFRRFLLIFVLLMIFLLSDSPFLLAYEKEIKSLSSTVAENIVKAGKKTIAVVDFVDLQGNVTELGRFLAEELSVALAGGGKGFEVVDRTHLKTLLKEHKLAETGVIDPSTAKKLGQIAGVDALVTGTITPLSDSVRLSVKILVTATAKMIGASSCDIPKTKAISELIDKPIEGETQAPGPSGPSRPRPTPKYSVKVQDFTFQLIEAKSGGDTVNCHILITNNASGDRNLYLEKAYGGAFIVDNFGNKYEITEILLGTQSSHGKTGAMQLLVGGVPTSAKAISNISPKAHKIALLEIRCIENNQKFKVQFRDIPLNR